ncbi:hypothetical protein NX059_011462 [Plenodomus lindquistii]|nr:hypothetical protein NX059_011462 [Plenodomus lindquistii]
METFKLTLSNNGTVNGIRCIPPPSTTQPGSRPLIVALHGGSYDHRYFDATPETSAALTSTALKVPFVAIDRPSYGGTSSILPLPENVDFIEQTGHWLHQHILPKIWLEFGKPNNCDCIILFGHSMGVMGATVAASLHAQDGKPLYPLGGLIASGMGNKARTRPTLPNAGPDHVVIPIEAKDHIMFKPSTASADVLAQTERLDGPTPMREMQSLFDDYWVPSWKDTAAHVAVPVMFALVDDDPFWVVNDDELAICTKAFVASSRVDGSLVKDAPHCMELSYWSRGWYARCFGFALECSAGFATSESGAGVSA